MSRSFTPKVLTGNALIKGDVIYRAVDGTWTRHLTEAELITEQGRAKLLLLQAEAQSEVVGPYLADAQHSSDGPRPVHFREDFRCSGPSNYAHGKQAELQ